MHSRALDTDGNSLEELQRLVTQMVHLDAYIHSRHINLSNFLIAEYVGQIRSLWDQALSCGQEYIEDLQEITHGHRTD